MATMKNSNIEWIGEVPVNWVVEKGKFHFTNNKYIPGIKSSEYDRLALTLKGVINRSKEDADGLQPKDFNTYQLLKENELVFKLIDLQNVSTSRVGLAHATGLVSPAYIVLHAGDKILPEYAEKFYLMMWHREIFNALGDNGVRSNLGVSDLLNVPITIPPLEVQKSIANFLDQKCSEIDSLSADIQSQIDILEEYKKSVITEAVTKGLNPDVEMKESGIEWIGMIPAHWDRGRIKDFCKITRGGSPRPIDNYLADENQKGYNWVRIGDTKKGYKFIDKTYLRIIPSGLSSTRLVKSGTLLLTNSMSFGEPYIMNTDGCIHDGWLAFYDYNNISKEFLYYVLMSDGCKTQFILSSAGAVVSNLNIDKVANTLIFVPSIEEQLCIASYLDNKCYQVNLAIEDKKAQLEILAEYKKSLIYEYVTGKKEVL